MTPPLRIGVDARELLGAPTGVGRYLGELLLRWTSRPDRKRRIFWLYSPEALPLTFPGATTQARIIGTGRGTWWEQTHLRKAVAQDQPDVFFAPAYTAPIGTDVPLAVTIHDISFVAHPEWFRAGEGLRRRWLTRRAAARARVIFTDSEFSRQELQTHLRADPSRIQVIPPGVTPRTPSGSGRTTREPIVLFVGSLFTRRRLPDLIAAFARVATELPDSRLVIVGDDRTWPRQDLPGVAERHGVAARTQFLSYVSDAHLSELYARASVFAFLSEYEGFGLTPLEALAAGVPPVVLDTPVAREVYRDAAIFVAAGDLDATATELRRFLIDSAAGRDVVSRAPALLRRYSWDAAAQRTLDAIEGIITR
jgi:glycosyltransferase involved in cell wall biosynthesis